MAGRIRSIKPEILDDEEVSALSDEAWRLWVSMWLLADDMGNCRAGDRYLAALVWQDSSRSPRVAEILGELRRSRIEVYMNGGERYAHIRNWEKHQRIDNAGKARVPGPDHEKSVTYDNFRRESPRTSESLGGSPLDLRPPTTDLRPRPPTTTPVAPSANGEPKPKRKRQEPTEESKRLKADTDAVCQEYATRWIAKYKPKDGKPPTVTSKDFFVARKAVATHGADAVIVFVSRYLADTSPFFADKAHPLCLMRVDSYRANVITLRAANSSPTHPKPEPHNEIDEDVTDRL